MLNNNQPDGALMNVLRQEDTPLVLSVLRAFHTDYINALGPPLWDIHNLEQGRGALLVQALKASVEQSYIGGMIVLLDPQRVQRVLQTVDPQIHSEGVTHLKFIAAVFEDNTDGIAHVWRDFMLGENGTERSIENIIDFLKTYKNASERYMVEQERQRLNQAVGEYPPKISLIKKM